MLTRDAHRSGFLTYIVWGICQVLSGGECGGKMSLEGENSSSLCYVTFCLLPHTGSSAQQRVTPQHPTRTYPYRSSGRGTRCPVQQVNNALSQASRQGPPTAMPVAEGVVAGFTAFVARWRPNRMHRICPACIDAKPSTKDASTAPAGKRKRGDKKGRGAGSSKCARSGAEQATGQVRPSRG